MHENLSTSPEKDLFHGFRIAVPIRRMSEVCRLLSIHRIPHEIELAVARVGAQSLRPVLTPHDGAN